MKLTLKHRTAALWCAPALALAAGGLHAQQQQQQAQQRPSQEQTRIQDWNPDRLYGKSFSADEMIDTDVRGPKGEEIGEVKDIFVDESGRISRVVVEVGGWLEIADQHIGVPWRDVRIGRNMEFVQVPLREVEDGTFSLYGRVPQGEDVPVRAREWRVNELIGEYARLEDAPRYGLVRDVLFDNSGRMQGVVVSRAPGAWGASGYYAYPYYGPYPYYPDGAAVDGYRIPYRTGAVRSVPAFDYARLADESPYAGDADVGPAARPQQGG